eukprot:g2443.t1
MPPPELELDLPVPAGGETGADGEANPNPFLPYSPRSLSLQALTAHEEIDKQAHFSNLSTAYNTASTHLSATTSSSLAADRKNDRHFFVQQPASERVTGCSKSRMKLLQSFEDFNADCAERLHAKSVLDCFMEGGCRQVEQKRVFEGNIPWAKKLSSTSVVSPRSTSMRGFGGPYGLWYHERASAVEEAEAARHEAERLRTELLRQQELAKAAESASPMQTSRASTFETPIKLERAVHRHHLVTDGFQPDEIRSSKPSIVEELVLREKGVMSPLQKIREVLPVMYSFKDPGDRPMLVNPSVETLAHIGPNMPILTQDNIDMKRMRSRVVANVGRNGEIIRDAQRTSKRTQRVLRLYTDVVKRSDREDAQLLGEPKSRFGMMSEGKRSTVLESSRYLKGSITKNLGLATSSLDASVKELERIKRRDEIQKRKAAGGGKGKDGEDSPEGSKAGFGQLMSFFT